MKTTTELQSEILENEDTINTLDSSIILGKIQLNDLLEKQNISVAKINKDFGKGNYLYEVFNHKHDKQIGRDIILAILIYLKADILEADQILHKFNHSKLYVKNKQDAIIFYCLNKKFTLEETNAKLHEYNFDSLI